MNIWENILTTVGRILNAEIPPRAFDYSHDLVRCKSNPSIVARRVDEPDGLPLNPGPDHDVLLITCTSGHVLWMQYVDQVTPPDWKGGTLRILELGCANDEACALDAVQVPRKDVKTTNLRITRATFAGDDIHIPKGIVFTCGMVRSV